MLDPSPSPSTSQPALPSAATTMPKPDMALKPAGFWGISRYPAKGDAYNYTLLGIGVAISAITALVLVWALRRASRTRTMTARPN